ncbi:hypothetical protein ERW52_20340 [Aliivibrio finisterrensis]|uniref:Uncharacterized protein n=1 Tax=Aliivibrio finisterrensis TaxID=511998 RepID=A0ABY0I145_9GAMM|nr:hypothetical protein ERW56_19190 [Aliivibrio finisterrensis]RYU52139.1 hypothetical protein ERW50_19335 [Aliivibrio finisterrensis]RYU58838.1 hypothetical protein ERW53_20330 [Aliivibrio finisterrensis]RYU78381.1 hypothetical protein ERW55_19310 [Aliivibrio finisterrensis]RYU78654.1 hypothetical protein ERW52_20340 [Aliivibrio finisterrensis]
MKRAKYHFNGNNCETKQSLFLTPFVRFGFSNFLAEKPNILTTIGIKNAASKTLMQTEMRQNHEQLKRELVSETHELLEIMFSCRT